LAQAKSTIGFACIEAQIAHKSYYFQFKIFPSKILKLLINDRRLGFRSRYRVPFFLRTGIYWSGNFKQVRIGSL